MVKKQKEKKTLVLLDSHAILHRAYHALPDFTSGDQPTGALYGLSLMLLKIINDLKPDYIVAAYDLPKPTYRHIAYEDYKAGRQKTDEDLVSQIKRSRDIFKAFNIPMYDKEGFEADDVLGTIVEMTKNNKDLDVLIASGDMDTLQLVSGEKVRVYTLKKGIKDTIIYNEDGVRERYGFGPELLPDFKGLRGDPSDNIPGIKGIGEKTATTLITKFGDIKSIYKSLKKSKTPFEKIGLTPRIIGLLEEGEEEALFSRELGEIRRDVPIDFSIPQNVWKESVEPKKILDLFSNLSFRTLSVKIKELFNVAPMLQEDVEVGVPTTNVGKEDIKKLSLAYWLLDSDTINPELEDVFNFSKTDSYEEAKKYIFSELKKQKLEKVYSEIEEPLIEVVAKMKERGIKVDKKYLKVLSKEYHKNLEALQKKIWKHAGVEFNINSPKQLGEVLYDKMGLVGKNMKKTSTGAKSTRESELQKLKDENPIIEEILSYRELQKLLSTYIDNIPEMVEKDGRLHADFNQAGATTGRMSSNNPNLHNIPIRTDLGRKIRDAFVVEKGYKLVAFDYSQIELRIAAFLSGDKKLIEIFKKGDDIHNAVAMEVFNVSSKEVTKAQRIHAKTINFGILYGMGVNALRVALGTDRATAQEFYNDYFEKFTGITDYLEKTKRETAKNGYTETFFGRRRHFPGIKSKLPFLRAQAERMAINAPIQGTQADIIKIAMIKIHQKIKNKDAHLLLQIHDELVYEIKDSLVKELAPIIEQEMENVLSLKESSGIKLEVDVLVGENWGDMKKISNSPNF
jgi:DNA polymerase I